MALPKDLDEALKQKIFEAFSGLRNDGPIIMDCFSDGRTPQRNFFAEARAPINGKPSYIVELLKCRRCGEFGCRAH